MAKGVHIEKINMKKLKLFIFNLLVCVLSLGTFVFNKHLSVDDYWIYCEQRVGALTDIQQNMRIFSGGFYYLLDVLGINTVEQQIFFGTILIVVFAWAVTKISLEVISAMETEADISKILFVNGGTLVLFLNAAVSEYLYYSGVYAQWIIGIIGITCGAVCVSREKRVLLNWLVGVLALTITAGSYQTFLAQYAYIVMVLIYIRNNGKINRKSIIETFRAIMAAVVAMGINLLGLKILVTCGVIGKGSRANFEWSNIPKQMKDIAEAQRSIWIEGIGIYHTGLLAVILLGIVGILAIILYKKKVGVQGAIFSLGVLISGLCVMYMAQIMQGYIRVTNRSMYAIFGVYTVCIWFIAYYLEDIRGKIIKQIGFCGISVFLIYSGIKINGIAIDVIKTNALSKCYIEEINRRISDYENQNNIRVTKIGFCSDASISYRYYNYIETSAYGDMCANPFLAEWSDINSFKYYSDRELERVDIPDNIVAYYAELNWDEADWDRQMIFDNDKVYICVF